MPCACPRAGNQARKAAPARTQAHAHMQYARKRALPRNPAAARTGRPGRGGRGQLSAGRPKVAPSSRRPQGAIRKNYKTQKKTVLALIQCRCQIAVVRFGVCRFRANGVENDGVTPKRGKSGRSETGGKPREGTQPGCRKPEERPPRHGGCGARAGRIGRGGLRAHRRPGAGARLLPRHPLPVAVSSPATGNAAGGPPTRRLHSFARRAAASSEAPRPACGERPGEGQRCGPRRGGLRGKPVTGGGVRRRGTAWAAVFGKAGEGPSGGRGAGGLMTKHDIS